MRIWSNAERKVLKGIPDDDWSTEYIRTLKHRIREKVNEMLNAINEFIDAKIYLSDFPIKLFDTLEKIAEKDGYPSLIELIKAVKKVWAKYYNSKTVDASIEELMAEVLIEMLEEKGDSEVAKKAYELKAAVKSHA